MPRPQPGLCLLPPRASPHDWRRAPPSANHSGLPSGAANTDLASVSAQEYTSLLDTLNTNLSTTADLRQEKSEEQEDPTIIEEDISLSDRVPKKGISNDLELEGGCRASKPFISPQRGLFIFVLGVSGYCDG